MRRLYVFLVSAALAACQSAPDSPELSSTSQEIITVVGTTRDFGSLQVGQTSGAIAITVNPGPGSNDDIIESVTFSAACNDFLIDAGGLPYEVYRICQECQVICQPQLLPCNTSDSNDYTFYVYFRPTVAAALSCAVNINTDSQTKQITLTGTGTVPPIDIDVQPGSVNFGDVRINTDSGGANISVRNLGGSTMTVSSAGVTGGYAMSGPASYTVAPGSSMTHTITCHPGATGAMGGTFTVNSNDSSTPQVNIPLACNGVDSAIGITPSPAIIPTTRVGEPVMQTIMIDNGGAASATLNDVTVSGDVQMISKPDPGTVVAAGGSVPVQVMFAASAQGDASGTLNISYDAGLTRTSQITAKAQLATMSINPDGEIDLGPVCAGQTKKQTFDLIGNSDGGYALNSISTPDAPFTLTAPTLPAAVQGLAANKISFDVTASPIAEGFTQSQITLATDIPNGTPHQITVDVTGLGEGVGATPVTLDLGSQPVDTTTIGQAATLTNCTDGAVTFSNPRITGPDAQEFAIVTQPSSLMIDATKSASWLIVLTAKTRGLKSATLLVDYDGGTAEIPLQGEGLAPPGPGRGSYYQCSVGGSAVALWPIAFVFAVVTIRRRRRR